MAELARRSLEVTTLGTLARKELRDALRNRWFILYTIAFAVLAVSLAGLSRLGVGAAGLATFGRTAAGLINLVILVIPLMALTAGAATLAGERERGTLRYLLAQPVNRVEVLLGKYIGLATAMLASLALGFGAGAVPIAISGGGDAAGYLRLVALAFVLALAMLSVGMLVSVIARRTAVAMGTAIVIWLTLVFLGDLGLMGSAIVFRLKIGTLFGLSLVNPLQVFKMASLDSLSASLDVLGPAGLYATRTFGAALDAIFAGVLAAWIVVPLTLATLLFARRGAS